MATIKQLSEADIVENGDQFPFFSEAQGDTRKVTFATLKDSVATDFVSTADLAAQTGATLVGCNGGTNVQQELDALDGSKASLAALAASGGSSLQGFIQSGTGAVAETTQAALRRPIFASQYGSIQQAIDEAFARGGGEVRIQAGTFTVATPITPRSGVFLKGVRGQTIIRATAAMTGVMYASVAVSDFVAEDIIFDANNQNSTSAVQFNQAAFTNITFTRCGFRNSKTAWTVLIGYVTGNPSTPGDATTALTWKSRNILFDNCRWSSHVTSTLEQCIIVNTDGVTFRKCRFEANDTNANSILIYAFSSNAVIDDCDFPDVQAECIGVQHSDNVWITRNRFTGETAMSRWFISAINAARLFIERNVARGTKASNPKFFAPYATSGARFESDNYLTLYSGCYDMHVNDNDIDGCYAAIECPGQKQSDKTFVFEGLYARGNKVSNCGGAPFIIGNYTVSDPVTQIQRWKRIEVCDNSIADYDGFDEGAIYVVGTSNALIPIKVNGNTIPQATAGTNAYGMRLSFVGNNFEVKGNNLYGKGSREAIFLENEQEGTVTGNDTNRFGIRFTADRPTHIADNVGCGPAMERHLMLVRNTHGSQIDAGSVVILKSVANQNEVSMTNTVGDYRVLGVMLANTANNAWGYAVVKGRVGNLRANGSTAIAIGDLLTPTGVLGVCRKATTGHTAFAFAAEAYSTPDSNGVLDALIVNPRLAA